MPHKRAKQSVREQKRKERGADLAPPGNTGNGAGISTERIPKSAARVLDAAKIRAEYRQKRARLQIEGADTTNDERERISAPKPPPRKKRRTDAAGAGTEKKGRGPAKARGKGEKNLPVDTIEIQPGESLKHFNRRVEDHMRPLVQSAIRASAATERKERKTTTTTTTTSSKAKSQPLPPPTSKAPVKKDAPSSTTTTTAHDGRPKEFATTSSAAPRRLNDIATAPPELKRLPRGATTRTQRGGGGSDGGGKTKAGKAGVLSMAQRVMMEAERENAIRRYREMKERKVEEGEGHDHVDGG